MTRGTVVFLHAHPDDEAIFTGGSIHLLAATGWRVVVVMATSGEQGLPHPTGAELGTHRRTEAEQAAAVLGAHRVEFLGYADSGLVGDHPPGAPSFIAADPGEAADRLAAVLDAERADALITYDADGIYGHPDHVRAHEVALAAVEARSVTHLYEVTVDREYLHFVETHLVVEAGLPERPPGLGLAATHLGRPTVVIDTVCDVRPVLGVKRQAMASHASQIPDTSSAMRLDHADFAAVYGYEWYLRHGPPGPLEQL